MKALILFVFITAKPWKSHNLNTLSPLSCAGIVFLYFAAAHTVSLHILHLLSYMLVACLKNPASVKLKNAQKMLKKSAPL